MKFNDRISAGKKLAKIIPEDWKIDTIYGIANGGVIVASEVSTYLKKRLDVAFVSKLPLPWNPETAIGVVAVSGKVLTNEGLYRKIGLSFMDLQKITRERLSFLKRRQGNILSEKNLEAEDVTGKNILIIDDGLATGFTALGAVKDLKKSGAENIYVAAPVVHKTASTFLSKDIDGITQIVESETRVFAVSSYYRMFDAVGDKEVREVLKKNRWIFEEED